MKYVRPTFAKYGGVHSFLFWGQNVEQDKGPAEL